MAPPASALIPRRLTTATVITTAMLAFWACMIFGLSWWTGATP